MFDLFRRLGSRDAKPNPDAFWSDKWGWMDEASAVDLIAEIRSRVESGTIKGHIGTLHKEASGIPPGRYLVIPVSDGGEDRP